MAKVELRRLVGQFREVSTGKVRSVGWNMDQLLLDGRQIAMINRVPGAPVGLFPGVILTASQKAAVEDAISKERGGVKPAHIGSPIESPYELLDDDEGDDDETEVDDE